MDPCPPLVCTWKSWGGVGQVRQGLLADTNPSLQEVHLL